MKKTLLTMFMAITTAVAMAQTTNYTDNLIVTIDGESTEPQETTITVEQNTDGTYKLALNNFTLGGMIQVGNIVLDGITVTENNGIKSFQTNQEIFITAGDGNEDDWMGPMLGAIPVSITGKMDAEKLYCTIDIDLGEMIVNVVFGEEDKVTSIENIAVENGSAGATVAEETIKGTTINKVTAMVDALSEVLAGTSDVAIIDITMAQSVVGKGAYADLQILDGASYGDEIFAVGLRQGSDLKAELDAFLKAKYADGTMTALAEKYSVGLNTDALK